MIYLEAFLVTILVLLLGNATVSDLKTSKISNRSIIICLGMGVVALVPYYAFFATDCLFSYVINNVLSFAISIALYSSGAWGAGDCKLLCVVTLLFPARLYCMKNNSLATCFVLIALIFLAAFVYVIGESIYLGCRQKNLFKTTFREIDSVGFIKNFLFYFMAINLWNVVLTLVMPGFILEDAVLISAMHFLLVLIIMRMDSRVSWWMVGIMSVCWGILLFFNIANISFSDINWKIYLLVLVLILFRSSAEKYNYKEIAVAELKSGMILALATTFKFTNSKVQGLPAISTEDLRSRLSESEVVSIVRWAKTKSGEDTVIIVRKMPFALFITIGTILFTILEVLI